MATISWLAPRWAAASPISSSVAAFLALSTNWSENLSSSAWQRATAAITSRKEPGPRMASCTSSRGPSTLKLTAVSALRRRGSAARSAVSRSNRPPLVTRCQVHPAATMASTTSPRRGWSTGSPPVSPTWPQP